MWIDKVPPTAMGIVGDRWVGFTVKVTLPDKTTTTLGPYTSDDAGGYATTYVPTELGNYTMVFSFPGETLTGNQGNPSVPASENNDPSAVGDVYGPSTSAPASFTVGTTPASTIPQNPLPTGYWQTPVEAFNNNWYVIDGNWLGICPASFSNTGDYAFTGNFNPYSTAVLSPHIVWTRSEIPGAAGGQMGGEFGSSEQANYFYGCAYQPKFAPIVMNGVVYYDAYPGESTGDGGHDGWVAVNLRTGQTIWTQNYLNYFAPGSDDFLMCGQIYVYKNMNYYGGDTYLWAFRTTNGVNYYDLFDAASGKYILSISGAGMGGIMFNPTIEGSDGSLLQYYINFTFNPDGSESQSLTFWNSSTCLNPTQSQFWGPGQNTVIPYSQGIVWSVPLPNSLNGVPFGPGVGFSMTNVGTAAYDPVNNIMVIQASAGPAGWYPGWVIEAGYNLNTGAQLWIKNETVPPFSSVLIIPGAESGVYAEFDKEALTWSGYSTLTGQKVWGPTEPYANPLGYYDGCSALCAYGNLYTWTFGGWVYCYNMTNGNLVWSWNDGSAGENTPYGVNTLWISTDSFASIADGVIYVESGHNYGPPLYNGAQLYALNTTNGKEIWSILNFDTGSCPCIVDGYLLVFNAYDNQIYCYGKGLTATTVTTSPTIGSSTQVLISGTVTDQSPGQTCLGIPAAGTPAIADQYMNQWMEYLYEQSPEPTNATGVPVTLTEIDPNNNTYTIGVTTSNIAGHYNYVFTPNVPGIYTIIATFGGSNSYFSSTAQTSFNFVPPAPATPTPTPTPASLVNTYFVPAVIAIIIVILIVGAVLFLALRKRP
jgi:outer membrane protein assembly factor BamB